MPKRRNAIKIPHLTRGHEKSVLYPTSKLLIFFICFTICNSLAEEKINTHLPQLDHPSKENRRLAELFNADQSARNIPHSEIDWSLLDREDKNRREKVLKILAEGRIRTSKDYHHAALIFQHGNKSEDIRLAHALATIAATLAEDKNEANWLKAATWDRLMMNLGRPQWYGTQFVKDDSGNWSLYNIDSDIVSDQQRIDWSVRTLEESKAMEKSLNSKKKSEY
ncbi:hypothetical protein BTJ40_12410 [Microbulbifer sp. A4B17]|uniref:hypothetical protein n=1 Tax=Microbulbifer sp. A4B17 TaxID=359370 RepID=UPI000D52C540|nr:hypothetical protein [Microbulbifer sp. A4B17]AWF81561.1 hypothetical protein BTJ40_12410 [Microbulbifer sp. A4B17]